jgi:hypothetical protein
MLFAIKSNIDKKENVNTNLKVPSTALLSAGNDFIKTTSLSQPIIYIIREPIQNTTVVH